MTQKQKTEIEIISKEFAAGFKDSIGGISGSGCLIVDPLSGYLNFLGHENKLDQMPAKDGQPQILIMTFNDGTMFIPSGSGIKHKDAKDWMWIDK